MSIRTKIFSAFMLFALTFSTIGIVMNKHLCSGSVKNVSAFVNAEQCEHSEMANVNVPKCHKQKSADKKDCCKNDTEELKNKEQSLTYNKIDIKQLSVLQAVITTLFIIEDSQIAQNNPSIYESPPPLAMRQSLHKIYEQFLI